MTNVNTPVLSLPPTVGSLDGTEVVPLVQLGTTKRATVKQLGTGIFTSNFPATIEYVIDGGGSNLTTGVKGYLVVPFDCTIQSATMLADGICNLVIDIWKCTEDQFDAGLTAPKSSNSITGGSPPTISSTTKYFSQALSTWTSSLAQADVLAYNVMSVLNCGRATLSLQCIRYVNTG